MKTRTRITVSLAAVAAAATIATATTAGAAVTVAATPAPRGYLQQDLQRDLNAITATGVPGVLAEVRAGGRELRGTSGVADLDSRAPVNPGGFFRIGSNTKTFIAVVALQLVAAHRLSLDDTVERWLPGVVSGNGNDGAQITVRQLLQHTSGLHNYTDDLQARITSPGIPPVQPARPAEHRARQPAGLRPRHRLVPGSRYGLGIWFVPLSCGGGYWSHEGDVPGYDTVSAVSSDGRTTVVLSVNSNIDDPVLAAEYGLIDHVMCRHA